MIDQKRITEEAEHFFEWPDPKNKTYVTLASCSIFAATIAEMVRKEERERCAMICEAMTSRSSEYDAATMDCAAAIRGPNVADKRHGTVLRDGSA